MRLCVFLWWNFWRLKPCLYSFSISCLLKDFSTLENENSSLPRSRLKVLEAALVIEIIFHFLVFLWMRLFFVIEICREEISLVRPLISRFWGYLRFFIMVIIFGLEFRTSTNVFVYFYRFCQRSFIIRTYTRVTIFDSTGWLAALFSSTLVYK